jgi:hypothetical protein
MSHGPDYAACGRTRHRTEVCIGTDPFHPGRLYQQAENVHSVMIGVRRNILSRPESAASVAGLVTKLIAEIADLIRADKRGRTVHWAGQPEPKGRPA